MSQTAVHVRPAGPADEPQAVGVITLAFAADPMVRWAFPDPGTYLNLMPDFVRAFGGNGLAHGATHLVDGGLGAAMWLPPGVQPDSDTMMSMTQRYIRADRVDDMMQVLAQMDKYHPVDDCWYLPLIGVDPLAQGRGCGAALLRYALQSCDRDGIAAYLESSNPRNISLYERHGFERLGTIQAGASPTMVPMLRRPRRQ